MATFHLDYVNGNDANDGSTWALAWKTMTTGATAARIAPGDLIKIAKSPDPTSLGQAAQFTDLSRTVTLTTAVTKNVYLDGAWTAAANITCTTDTTNKKEGANCSSIAFGAAFTTGLAAYYPLGSAQDFSAYQQLSFWIRTTAALTAGQLQIKLCSDALGATAVDTLDVPAVPGTGQYQVVIIDKGSALGASIQSVALYAVSDPGTPTVLLDNIIACKASSAADSLTLSSLISKNTGDEGWFGLKSINGTTLEIDNHTNSLAGAGRGYTGTTESVTIWKRETTKTIAVAATGTVVQQIMDSGTDGSLITFAGGYNIATGLVDGETFFDGLNGFGAGLSDSQSFIATTGLSFVRYYTGVLVGGGLSKSYGGHTLANCSDRGLSVAGVATAAVAYKNAINNQSAGVWCSSGRLASLVLSNANGNGSYGVIFGGAGNCPTAKVSFARNNGSTGCGFSLASGTRLEVGSTTNNGTAAIYSDNGSVNYLVNSTLASPKITAQVAGSNGFVWSTNEGGDTDTHFGYTDGGLIASETSVRHTASGISWKLSPTSANRSSAYPLPLKVGAFAFEAGVSKTVSIWMRRTNTGLTMRLKCFGGQLTGVSDTTSSMTAAADTWEQVSVTVTPTQKGVMEFYAECWGGTTYSGYVDDISIA